MATKTVRLSEETIARLQKFAVPLEDTYDSVIAKVIALAEQVQEKPKRSKYQLELGLDYLPIISLFALRCVLYKVLLAKHDEVTARNDGKEIFVTTHADHIRRAMEEEIDVFQYADLVPDVEGQTDQPNWWVRTLIAYKDLVHNGHATIDTLSYIGLTQKGIECAREIKKNGAGLILTFWRPIELQLPEVKK